MNVWSFVKSAATGSTASFLRVFCTPYDVLIIIANLSSHHGFFLLHEMKVCYILRGLGRIFQLMKKTSGLIFFFNVAE